MSYKVTWTHITHAMCHLYMDDSQTSYAYLSMTPITLALTTCHPLIHARMSHMVGDATETLGV